jgi:hypothetical protein
MLARLGHPPAIATLDSPMVSRESRTGAKPIHRSVSTALAGTGKRHGLCRGVGLAGRDAGSDPSASTPRGRTLAGWNQVRIPGHARLQDLPRLKDPEWTRGASPLVAGTTSASEVSAPGHDPRRLDLSFGRHTRQAPAGSRGFRRKCLSRAGAPLGRRSALGEQQRIGGNGAT